MAQVFHPSSNTIAKASVLAALLLVTSLVFASVTYDRSPYVTQVFVPSEQPVQFSHEHHVGGLGIDCRFCHTTVEDDATAGMPSTDTCMTCHSVIWQNSAMLQPVRSSLADGKPIRWNRVHDLPDFAYFNHSIHLAKGVGCYSCHGRVDQMPLMWKVHTLRMEWCLDCHRAPEKHLRPREFLFDVKWQPPQRDPSTEAALFQQYKVRKKGLTDCSVCHH
jgi:hypothetical protein